MYFRHAHLCPLAFQFNKENIDKLKIDFTLVQEAEYFAGQDRLPEAHPCQQAQKKGVTRKRKASLNVFS